MSETAELGSPQGEITIVRAAPGVLRSTAVGHLTKAHVDHLIDRTHAEIASHADGAVASFIDASGTTGYDTKARTAATRWVLSLDAPYPEIHVFTRHRVVGMGVAAAFLTLQLAGRPAHAYRSAPSFESAFRARLG